MKKLLLSTLALVFVFAFVGTASADVNAVTPSTNDINRTNGWAHVNVAGFGNGTIDLEFVSTRGFASCFEYRTDGDTSQATGANYNPAVTDGLYPFTCVNNSTVTKTISANDYVEVRMVFGAEGDERFDWTTFEIPFERTAEITAPNAGEEIMGDVDFTATLNDKDGDDDVQWAIREGTCAAGVGTIYGNVDGFSDDYDWDGESFSATADTTLWNDGPHCFVFNPKESAGDESIRLTREFVVANPPATPTGLDRYAPDEDRRYACGDVSLIQRMWPDWDDNTEDDFSHYEYSSFNPTGPGIDERVFTDSVFEYTGTWLPGFGTYGYAVRAVDLAGNKSDWALSDETLEGSCQITYIGELSATPLMAHNPVFTKHTVTVDINSDVEDVDILFIVEGANSTNSTKQTDENGIAKFTYKGNNAGEDTITVCVDQNYNGECDENEVSIEVTKNWYEPSVNGGGQIIEETGKKSKDWLKVSFGGTLYALGGYGYVGEWQVNLHNVNNDALDKSKFHGSEVVALNMFEGNSGTCNDATNFTVNGTFDGEPGYSMVFRAGDFGSPNTADTVRVTIFDKLNGKGATVYDSHAGGEFTDESSCVGTARTGLDKGNITIFNN